MDQVSEPTSADSTINHYWEGDTGSLDFDSRRALLSLVRGPYIDARKDSELWRALLGHQVEIRSRLADLFLELIVDEDAGVAFVRNVTSEEIDIPKAVRSQALTLINTIMVLFLRRELLNSTGERAFIGRDELFDQMAQYQALSRLDEAGFRKRLDSSWSTLIKAGVLYKMEGEEDRYEISPVLPLVFGVEESRVVADAFEAMVAAQNRQAALSQGDDYLDAVEGDLSSDADGEVEDSDVS